uniref:MFS domain-containing protein n=1 Tax=Meloidogyne incognita TaxID=6306 RepID=A0A914N9Y8_MELIC
MELTKNEEKKSSPLVEIFLDPNSLDSLSNSLSSTTTSKNPFSTGFSKVFHTRTRFLMMILCLLCLASVWSNILCFNFALICIDHAEGIELEAVEQQQQINGSEGEMSLLESVTENESFGTNYSLSTLDNNNSTPTNNSKTPRLHFTARQRIFLTSTVALAALISNFAVVSLVNHCGIRTVFACLGMLSAISTCLLPAAIELGFYYVLACRFLQGIAFSANFPVIGSFTSKWTYYKQNGLFVSALVAYVQLAPAITMPVSGALCELLGWPSVFFAHGGACSILFSLWALFFRNSPNKHPFVGEVELRKIAVGKTELNKELQKKIPIREILRTASVWAVWIAAIGNFVCVNMMFLYSPSYLNVVLRFPVAHTGFSASLAPLAQFCIKLLAGFTSDKIIIFKRFDSCLKQINYVFTIQLHFFGSGLFLSMLAFFPTDQPTLCLVLLGISAGLLGFTTGGFFKAGPLVAKHYALVVMGQISLAITITLLLVPIMQNTLAPHNKAEEWRYVFLLTAAVLTISNLAFCLMCSAEPAHWTTDEFSRNASRSKIHTIEESIDQNGQSKWNNN